MLGDFLWYYMTAGVIVLFHYIEDLDHLDPAKFDEFGLILCMITSVIPLWWVYIIFKMVIKRDSRPYSR